MEKFIKPSSKFDNFKYTVNALISLSSLNLFSGKCDEIQIELFHQYHSFENINQHMSLNVLKV